MVRWTIIPEVANILNIWLGLSQSYYKTVAYRYNVELASHGPKTKTVSTFNGLDRVAWVVGVEDVIYSICQLYL